MPLSARTRSSRADRGYLATPPHFYQAGSTRERWCCRRPMRTFRRFCGLDVPVSLDAWTAGQASAEP
jgi:hypothetical protein